MFCYHPDMRWNIQQSVGRKQVTDVLSSSRWFLKSRRWSLASATAEHAHQMYTDMLINTCSSSFCQKLVIVHFCLGSQSTPCNSTHRIRVLDSNTRQDRHFVISSGPDLGRTNSDHVKYRLNKHSADTGFLTHVKQALVIFSMQAVWKCPPTCVARPPKPMSFNRTRR